MKLILIALIAITCINALTTEESFKLWASKNHRNYENYNEFTYRLGVYRSNVQFVEEHNRMNKGFTVAINQFADMTASEFADLYNNYQMNPNRTLSSKVHTHDNLYEMAASVDWRTKGIVTGVKNQGQCGSCWAFSATGSAEGQHALKTGTLVSLSEQNLVDCSGSFGNGGCQGGLMDSAFKYIISNNGINTEASYPYTARDGTCKFNTANIGATLSSYVDISQGSEAALQNAIQSVGPVSVAIDASRSSFQFYSGGVYYEPSCSPTQLDHGVLAVGYGTESGEDYYIVKNSWGTSWGMSGYILMARNRNNNCGIATMASYPVV